MDSRSSIHPNALRVLARFSQFPQSDFNPTGCSILHLRDAATKKSTHEAASALSKIDTETILSWFWLLKPGFETQSQYGEYDTIFSPHFRPFVSPYLPRTPVGYLLVSGFDASIYERLK
jgi:hypothetical protein